MNIYKLECRVSKKASVCFLKWTSSHQESFIHINSEVYKLVYPPLTSSYQWVSLATVYIKAYVNKTDTQYALYYIHLYIYFKTTRKFFHYAIKFPVSSTYLSPGMLVASNTNMVFILRPGSMLTALLMLNGLIIPVTLRISSSIFI